MQILTYIYKVFSKLEIIILGPIFETAMFEITMFESTTFKTTVYKTTLFETKMFDQAMLEGDKTKFKTTVFVSFHKNMSYTRIRENNV